MTPHAARSASPGAKDGAPRGDAAGPAAPARGLAACPRPNRGWSLPQPVPRDGEAGARKVVDYQDPQYGQRISRPASTRRSPGTGPRDGIRACRRRRRSISPMPCAYDDIIRVADLKTRSSAVGTRSPRDRCRQRNGAAGHRVFPSAHRGILRAPCPPALADGSSPARSLRGGWAGDSTRAGTSARTGWSASARSGWSPGLRRLRRGLLRHGVETAHIDRWYDTAIADASTGTTSLPSRS